VSFVVIEIKGVRVSFLETQITSTVSPILVEIVATIGTIVDVGIQVIVWSTSVCWIGKIQESVFG
jgi:hypothetical protein